MCSIIERTSYHHCLLYVLLLLLLLRGNGVVSFSVQKSGVFLDQSSRAVALRLSLTSSSLEEQGNKNSKGDEKVAVSSSSATTITTTNSIRLFLDIEVAKEAVGRLTFEIPNVNLLPLQIENIKKLCTQEQTSLDPRCKYIGCEFQHSPQFVEGFAQYRWGHTLRGRGRNAVGRADQRISDPENMRKCTHSVYGGQYYGLNYDTEVPKQLGDDGRDTTVVLTVPLVGPGRGSTDLSIVRVGESPPEWKERLLLNNAVVGWMDPSSMEALYAMARQTKAPPKVVGSGVL